MVSAQEILFTLIGQDELTPTLNQAKDGFDYLKQAAEQMGISTNDMMNYQEQYASDAADKTQAMTDAMGKYQSGVQDTTDSIANGLSPAMLGINTDKLEQLGVETAPTAATAVDKISASFNGLKLAAGAALTYIGMYMQQFLSNSIGMASTVQSETQTIDAAFGKSAFSSAATFSDASKLGSASGYTTEQVLPAEQQLATGTHGNYNAALGLMPDITAMATLTSEDPSDVASVFNNAMMGRAQGLAKLGITGQLPTDFMSEDPSQKVATLNTLLAQNKINVDAINKAYQESPAGQLAKAQNEENTIEEKLGANILPLIITGLNDIEPLLNTIMNNKALMDIFTVLVIGITGLTLLAGPIMALNGLGLPLNKLFGGIKTKLSSLLGLSGKGGGKSGGITSSIKSCIPTCDSGLNGSSSNSRSSKGKGSKGRELGYLEEEGENIPLGNPKVVTGTFNGTTWVPNTQTVIGDAENSGGLLSKIPGLGRLLGGGGKLGMIGDLAMGGSDLIPGLGELMMGGQAAYGAWNGWNDTKGNDGDKAKGAIGGAVSSLSMGLISQGQVVGGINIVQKAVEGLSPKVKADVGNIGKTVSAPFISGFNYVKGTVGNGVNYLKGAWGIINSDVDTAGAYMEGAWKNTVNSVEGTWKSLVSGVTNELTQIGSAIIHSGGTLYNDAIHMGQQIYKGVMNGLGIHSPGFIQQSVISELEGVNGVLGSYANTLGSSAKYMGTSMTNGFGSNHLNAAGATHIHQHNENITIDASHMDERQLMSVLTKMLEGLNKTVVPNIQVS